MVPRVKPRLFSFRSQAIGQFTKLFSKRRKEMGKKVPHRVKEPASELSQRLASGAQLEAACPRHEAVCRAVTSKGETLPRLSVDTWILDSGIKTVVGDIRCNRLPRIHFSLF